MINFGREPSPWTTSVFDMLEYSIRGVFNKWGNTVDDFGFVELFSEVDFAENSSTRT